MQKPVIGVTMKIKGDNLLQFNVISNFLYFSESVCRHLDGLSTINKCITML
jgi:hypothetical protein